MASVTIYSTPGCPWCAKTKEFLKEHKVKFKDVDVASDSKAAKQMIEKSGQTGVPVIVIGKEVIIGFDKDAISSALKLK